MPFTRIRQLFKCLGYLDLRTELATPPKNITDTGNSAIEGRIRSEKSKVGEKRKRKKEKNIDKELFSLTILCGFLFFLSTLAFDSHCI